MLLKISINLCGIDVGYESIELPTLVLTVSNRILRYIHLFTIPPSVDTQMH